MDSQAVLSCFETVPLYLLTVYESQGLHSMAEKEEAKREEMIEGKEKIREATGQKRGERR